MPAVKLTSGIAVLEKAMWFSRILKVVGNKEMSTWEIDFALSKECKEKKIPCLGESTLIKYLKEMTAKGMLRSESVYVRVKAPRIYYSRGEKFQGGEP